MTQRTFNVVAGTVFLVIALVHALRLICGWAIVINGWVVPHGVSWIPVGLFGVLAYTAFRLKRSGR